MNTINIITYHSKRSYTPKMNAFFEEIQKRIPTNELMIIDMDDVASKPALTIKRFLFDKYNGRTSTYTTKDDYKLLNDIDVIIQIVPQFGNSISFVETQIREDVLDSIRTQIINPIYQVVNPPPNKPDMPVKEDGINPTYLMLGGAALILLFLFNKK